MKRMAVFTVLMLLASCTSFSPPAPDLDAWDVPGNQIENPADATAHFDVASRVYEQAASFIVEKRRLNQIDQVHWEHFEKYRDALASEVDGILLGYAPAVSMAITDWSSDETLRQRFVFEWERFRRAARAVQGLAKANGWGGAS